LQYILIIIGFAGVILSLILTFVFTDKMRKQIFRLNEATEITKKGNFKNRIDIKSKDELGNLADAFNGMLDELEKNQKAKNEYSEFITLINQNASLSEISDAALNKIIQACNFTVGAIYSANR
jgi:nitrogen fixation/metabolism regulation signal transduction histidine kinase